MYSLMWMIYYLRCIGKVGRDFECRSRGRNYLNVLALVISKGFLAYVIPRGD